LELVAAFRVRSGEVESTWSFDVPFVNLQIMNGSRKERKEVLLEEHDPIWVELRDLFIADVGNFGSSDSLQCFGFWGGLN